jgi:hypothetical protein
MRRLLLALLVLFSFGATPARAQYDPWTETNYHDCIVVNFWIGYVKWYTPIPPRLEDSRSDPNYLSPPGYNLGTTTYRQGAFQYPTAIGAHVGVMKNLLGAMADQRMKTNAPVTGRGVTSWGFQQWVAYSLESYEAFLRVKKIYDALKAGQLTLNLYELAPKIALQQVEGSGLPTGSITTLSLVPASQSEWHRIKALTDFSSPEYRFSNKVNLSELSALKVNVNVKPGVFMRTFGDSANTDTALWNQAKNGFEMMVALSQLKRGVVGTPVSNGGDHRMSRFTPATLGEKTEELVNLHARLQEEESSEIATVLQGLNPEAARDFRRSSAAVYAAERRAAVNALRGLSERYARAFYKARDVMNEMNNHVQTLESPDYLRFAGETDAALEKYTTKEGTADLGADDALQGQLGVDGTIARYDKLINDELAAIRKIVAIRARRQVVQDYAPYLGKTEGNINEAVDRLAQIQARNAAMDAAISAREKVGRH